MPDDCNSLKRMLSSLDIVIACTVNHHPDENDLRTTLLAPRRFLEHLRVDFNLEVDFLKVELPDDTSALVN